MRRKREDEVWQKRHKIIREFKNEWQKLKNHHLIMHGEKIEDSNFDALITYLIKKRILK